jgi:hypothetical protein
MKMTGQFRIALLPSADPQAFEEHMKNTVFKGSALKPTRITRSFSHTLLQGSMRQYVWQAAVDLQTDAGYNFAENAAGVQNTIADFGVLIGVEAFTDVE